MTAIEEIKSTLRSRGLSATEISAFMSQAKIKEAVSGQSYQSQNPFQFNSANGGENGEMYPSIMQQQIEQNPDVQQDNTQEAPIPQEDLQYNEQYPQETMASPYQTQYQQPYDSQYQPYQSAISPETITELAEQVITEKLSPLSAKMEKIISSRTTFESRIQSIQERLERIEKIND